MEEGQRHVLNIRDAMLLAGDQFRTGQFREAELLFRQINKCDPDDFNAIHCIGVCLLEQEKAAEAMPWFDRAGELLRDELITVACNQAKACAETGDEAKALMLYEKVLRQQHNHMLAWYGKALVLLQQGRHQAAITMLDVVLENDPKNDKARFARGFANLVLGNYESGFADYECRLKDEIEEPKQPLWTGKEDLQGKTILVHGEQGLGDNIMFARYLPMLVARGAEVLVWVPASVKPLLAHLEGVQLIDGWRGDGKEISFDYWIRFMSLAWAFGTTQATVPPPVPLRLRPRQYITENFTEGKRIGICWTGSRKSRYDAHRSVPLAALAPLFRLGHRIYSLQMDIRDEDREAFCQLSPIDLAQHCHSFQDTAEFIASLDCVITCDTSVAHLAGTVGVPTYVMLTAFRTYWLWIANQDRSPWYPSVRLFRQQRDGDWAPVIQRIVEAL